MEEQINKQADRLVARCNPEDMRAFTKKFDEEWGDISVCWAAFIATCPDGILAKMAWGLGTLGFIKCVYFLGYRRGKCVDFMSSIRVAPEKGA